ncbi:MAG: DUF998 domain-containing protein [Promethearchaeota archaeon]
MSKKKLYSLLTTISSTVGLIAALVLYLLSDTSYRPWKNYISDLGSGPIGATIALSFMLGSIALFVSLLMITISKEIKKFGVQTLFLFVALFAQISVLMLAIFPMNPSMPKSYEIHVIWAIFYFGFSAVSDFFLAIIEFKTSKLSFSMILMGGIFSLLFAIGLALQEYGIIPRNAVVYLTEWAYFLFVMAWLSLKILPLKKK